MSTAYEPLRAGPITASWDPVNGGLRWIRWGDHELVRGVYGAVRDQNWGTVTPVLNDVEVLRSERSFLVTFKAVLNTGDIDFEWVGAITGKANGDISYSFSGLSHSRFLRQRIGLCVLHPIRECRGQPCRVIHTDAAVEHSVFPVEVSPHQPFRDIAAIIQPIDDRAMLTLILEGETFETEDQRNWTDASFKTYGTPLDLPRPVWVEAGNVIHQKVGIRMEAVQVQPDERRDAVAEFQTGTELTLPRLGFEVSPDMPLPAGDVLSRLKALRPDHLRFSVDVGSELAASRLLAAADLAREVGTTLHVAITLGDEPELELERFAAAIAGSLLPVAVWVVFHRDEASTSCRWVDLARERLGFVSPGALFGGGTDQNFAELNRDRRPRTGFDAVSFAINPQVHAFDDDSIAETLEAQGDAIRTTRSFARGLPIIAGPVVLEPRFAPDGQRQTSLDPRLSQPFSAAWALGSIAALASAETRFATYFEVAGPRGIFDRPAGESSPAVRVFADLAELRNARWATLSTTLRTVVQGLEYVTSETRGALLTNPGSHTARIRLPFDVQRQRGVASGRSSVDWQLASGRQFELPPHSVLRVEGQR